MKPQIFLLIILLILGTFVIPLNTNNSYGDGILLFTVHRVAGSGDVNTENLIKERCFVYVQIDVYSSHHGSFHRNNPDMKVLQDKLEFDTVQNVIDYSQNQVTPIDKTLDVFEVGYEIDIIGNDPTKGDEDTNNVINSYLISPQFPFPVSGTLYSPVHIVEPFKESEFQLISFVSSDGIIEQEEIVIEQDNTIKEEIH